MTHDLYSTNQMTRIWCYIIINNAPDQMLTLYYDGTMEEGHSLAKMEALSLIYLPRK